MSNVLKPPCDEASILSDGAIRPCAGELGPWVLAATILGSSMAFIDGSVVGVILPILQSELNATMSEVQWIVESYALLLAALMLVGGALGDRFGRRRIFGLGVGLFALASAWCGVAATAGQLIAARAAQGFAGALLVPGSLAIISASFGDAQRGRAIGTWSAFTAITAAIGPVLGGWLVDSFSWRWVFYINIPIAAVVLAILFLRVPESRNPTQGTLDWIGAALAAAGLGSLVFGLVESSNIGLGHPLVVTTVAAGAAVLGLFVVVESRVAHPMMPPALFRSRRFSGANLVTLLLYSALSGALFFVPFNLIQVQGYSATAAGAALLPLILIIFLLSRWAGGLIPRYGARAPLISGPLVAACGYVLLAVPGIGGSYWTTFFPAMAVLGVGMAISVAPLTTAVMDSVAVERSGVASGINNAVSRTAGLLSVAVLGVVIVVVFGQELAARVEPFDLSVEARESLDAERINLAAAAVPAGLDDQLSASVERAIAESFVGGFRYTMVISALLAVLSALAAFLLIEDGRSTSSTAGFRARSS